MLPINEPITCIAVNLSCCYNCGCERLTINATHDINYPIQCWFVSRVVCGNCHHTGPVARCSDITAASEQAVYLWNKQFKETGFKPLAQNFKPTGHVCIQGNPNCYCKFNEP